MLIKSGADINLTMSDGKSPLHISAETGTINVLRYLLSNGAEPLEQDNVSQYLTKWNILKRIKRFFCMQNFKKEKYLFFR